MQASSQKGQKLRLRVRVQLARSTYAARSTTAVHLQFAALRSCCCGGRVFGAFWCPFILSNSSMCSCFVFRAPSLRPFRKKNFKGNLKPSGRIRNASLREFHPRLRPHFSPRSVTTQTPKTSAFPKLASASRPQQRVNGSTRCQRQHVHNGSESQVFVAGDTVSTHPEFCLLFVFVRFGASFPGFFSLLSSDTAVSVVFFHPKNDFRAYPPVASRERLARTSISSLRRVRPSTCLV